MKKYKVKEGFKIEENGNVYKAGDSLYLEPYRAEQLGLDKLEEILEVTAPVNADDSSSEELTALKIAYSDLETKLAAAQDNVDVLTKSSEELTGALKAAEANLETAQAEIEKLKKKK